MYQSPIYMAKSPFVRYSTAYSTGAERTLFQSKCAF